MSQFDVFKRLAGRIVEGEVVFFVGSGFSIDSESNGAGRLMGRLLVRFVAFQEQLLKHLNKKPRKKLSVSQRELLELEKIEVAELPTHLCRTFSLKPNDQEGPWNFDEEVRILASKYYQANDWFCSTFLRMLQISGLRLFGSSSLVALRNFVSELCEKENQILKTAGKWPDSVPLDPIDPRLFAWAKETFNDRSFEHGQHPGKALFLDTMGFANDEIMREGWTLPRDQALAAYQNRLFPRHHVLARLARENLCPLVLTTNYDLLLEGAWRLSGFEADNAQRDPLLESAKMPALPLERMARIGKATDFFRYERANRTSNVVKVHGCVELYRQVRSLGDIDVAAWLRGSPLKASDLTADGKHGWTAWQTYLPSMVFTFREIQHWRGESWVKDYLATTQRTRNVVFSGYSLEDPVIHDAFRHVYEGMRRDRIRVDGGANEELASDPLNIQLDALNLQLDAMSGSAWFWGQVDADSFHANAVLDAATAASGMVRCERTKHPNTIGFCFRNEGFPDYDEAFLWIFHQTFRKIQRSCLQTNLIQLSNGLLQQPILPRRLQRILDRFDSLIAREETVVKDLLEKSSSEINLQAAQRQLKEIVHWTYSFSAGLIKELVVIELLQRCGGPSMEISQLRSEHWYLPAIANRDATAWSVIVELAIRNLFRRHNHSDQPRDPKIINDFCYPAIGNAPVVIGQLPPPGLERNQKTLENIQLAIRTGEQNRIGSARENRASHRQMILNLPDSRFPWPRQSMIQNSEDEQSDILGLADSLIYLDIPSAQQMVQFALDDFHVSESPFPHFSSFLEAM